MAFDEKFEKYFLHTTNALVAQVYEQFIWEMQSIGIPFQSYCASGETEINRWNNCQQTDQMAPTINQEALGDWPQKLPFSTPFYDEINASEASVLHNETFHQHSEFVDNNIHLNNVNEWIEAMIGNQLILTAEIDGTQATISSGNGLNGNGIGSDNPIETSTKILTTACQNSVQPTIDSIIQAGDPDTNGVIHCLEMNNCMNEHQSVSALTPRGKLLHFRNSYNSI
ncbi:uncharacterized protein LOC116347485 [Contarinia nasturtii]|uniref:uncharacterized protein LOC116347485 n=1 Tax=Contarinia nasturtii TaxID=265458 RepID=UPI0012D4846B|nr:uncharacterized protein LOC116347485 [Contarinia nasturtii]